MRLFWLGLGFSPYLLVACYDGWLHEKARVVPRVEKVLHAGLFLSLIAFVFLVAREHTLAALTVLAVFITFLLIDELGYHAELARHERRVHWLADALLAGFVAFWLCFDGILG
jgi:dipeptide/tripeptide permease